MASGKAGETILPSNSLVPVQHIPRRETEGCDFEELTNAREGSCETVLGTIDLDLPDDKEWRLLMDKDSRKLFWMNSKTGTASWETPEGIELPIETVPQACLISSDVERPSNDSVQLMEALHNLNIDENNPSNYGTILRVGSDVFKHVASKRQRRFVCFSTNFDRIMWSQSRSFYFEGRVKGFLMMKDVHGVAGAYSIKRMVEDPHKTDQKECMISIQASHRTLDLEFDSPEWAHVWFEAITSVIDTTDAGLPIESILQRGFGNGIEINHGKVEKNESPTVGAQSRSVSNRTLLADQEAPGRIWKRVSGAAREQPETKPLSLFGRLGKSTRDILKSGTEKAPLRSMKSFNSFGEGSKIHKVPLRSMQSLNSFQDSGKPSQEHPKEDQLSALISSGGRSPAMSMDLDEQRSVSCDSTSPESRSRTSSLTQQGSNSFRFSSVGGRELAEEYENKLDNARVSMSILASSLALLINEMGLQNVDFSLPQTEELWMSNDWAFEVSLLIKRALHNRESSKQYKKINGEAKPALSTVDIKALNALRDSMVEFVKAGGNFTRPTSPLAAELPTATRKTESTGEADSVGLTGLLADIELSDVAYKNQVEDARNRRKTITSLLAQAPRRSTVYLNKKSEGDMDEGENEDS